jgi:hypothetical protein
MILTHCSKCEFHEIVEIDSELHSKCNKENCLSVYSNCVRVTAIERFISQNDPDREEKRPSALDICYPIA